MTTPLYRMPTMFGPQPGPRQRPDGGRWPSDGPTTLRMLSVTARTEPELLTALLPHDSLAVDGDTFTVSSSELRDLEWLAGRGYNTLGVSVPVVYSGTETVRGNLTLVLWESLADPIISGREELGIAKLYADVADLESVPQGHVSASAAWDGYTFVHTSATGWTADAPEGLKPPKPEINYRYVPDPGRWDRPLVTEILNAGTPPLQLIDANYGRGEVVFNHATFEQLPTLHHIVNRLAELPILGPTAATLITAKGFADFYDVRPLN